MVLEMEMAGGDQGWCGEGGALTVHLVASQEEGVSTWRKGHVDTWGQGGGFCKLGI